MSDSERNASPGRPGLPTPSRIASYKDEVDRGFVEEVLREHRNSIVQFADKNDVFLNHLIDHLMSKKCICEEQEEFIKKLVLKREKVTTLLNYVAKEGKHAFEQLCLALDKFNTARTEQLGQELLRSLSEKRDAHSSGSDSARHGDTPRATTMKLDDIPVTTDKYESQSPKKEINILLLGDTGVGKSTFINGFSAYFNYSSLQAAEEAAIRFPISLKVSVNEGQSLKPHSVVLEPDPNECLDKPGHSVTLYPKTYETCIENLVIRLIDTPGVNDTRGRKQDNTNIANTLNHIARYTHLNGICIFVKAGQDRLTESFEHCFRQIFSNLHEEAVRNIIFCFTHAQDRNFRSGSEVSLLREFIRKNGLEKMQVDAKSTCYVDNKVVTYLAEKQQNFIPDDDYKPLYRASVQKCWIETVKNIRGLLEHITTLPPNKIGSSLSLGFAKQVSKILATPLMDISCLIFINILYLENARKALEKAKRVSGFAENYKIIFAKYTVVAQKYMNVVCTSEKCMKVENGKRVYEQICHENCKCVRRRFCTAFAMLPGECKTCGCSYVDHERRSFEVQFTLVEDDTEISLEDQRKNVEEASQRILRGNDYIAKLNAKVDEMYAEKKKTIRSCAKLSLILRNNAILQQQSDTDYINKYVTRQQTIYSLRIAENMRKTFRHDAREIDTHFAQVMYNAFKDMESEYRQQLDELTRSGRRFQLADIDQLVGELFEMSRYGTMLKQAVETIRSCKAAELDEFVTHIPASGDGELNELLTKIGKLP